MTHDQERERFEKWCYLSIGDDLRKDDDGSYISFDTDSAWFIWQAGWQAAKRETVVSGEAVAYIDPQAVVNFKSGVASKEWMWGKPDAGLIPVFTHPPEAMAKDAERYRWLRSQNWNESQMFVAFGPKECVRLGTDCPSLERLDEAIDAAMATTPRGG